MSNAEWLVIDRFEPYIEGIEDLAAQRPSAPRPKTIEEALVEPSPCDGCRRIARCTAERLACSAFAVFVNSPDNSQQRWAMAPKNDASAYRYEQLNSARPANAIERRMLVSSAAR